MQHLKRKHNLKIDAQDINNMGGLGKLMPVTFITCTVASLALIGFPFTSGFLSKDSILIQSYTWGQERGGIYMLIPIAAILTSLLTTFYIGRLIFKVFFGRHILKTLDPDAEPHAHEGSWLLFLPMVVLALCSLFPLFSFNPFSYQSSWLFKGFSANRGGDGSGELIPVMVTLLNFGVIFIAYLVYVKQGLRWLKLKGPLFNISYNQWYIDRFYTVVIVKIIVGFSKMIAWFDASVIDGIVKLVAGIGLVLSGIAAWLDRYIIDGFLHLLATVIKQAGNFVRGFQTGRVQNYLFTMLIIVLALYILKTFI